MSIVLGSIGLGNIVPATTGCAVILVAINATEWIALNVTGTWTVN